VAYVETFSVGSVGDQVPLVPLLVHRYGGKAAGAGKAFKVLQLAVPLLTEVKNLQGRALTLSKSPGDAKECAPEETYDLRRTCAWPC
jgi:hypothetical protein